MNTNEGTMTPRTLDLQRPAITFSSTYMVVDAKFMAEQELKVIQLERELAEANKKLLWSGVEICIPNATKDAIAFKFKATVPCFLHGGDECLTEKALEIIKEAKLQLIPLVQERDKLLAVNESLVKDKERLDWLSVTPSSVVYFDGGVRLYADSI